MSSATFGMLLGLLVGLRHAFEPDHLTAVSTLVAETHSPKHGAWLGMLWGVGHTISLLAVGIVLCVIGAELPARAGVIFELAVAVMLLFLGARAIVVTARDRDDDHAHPHAHGDGSHPHSHVRARGWRRFRTLFVGLVHGLAGSGALTALVFAQLPTFASRVIYMAVFGAGSIAGMAIASGVAGGALQVLARSERNRHGIGYATGAISIVVGFLWGIPLLSQLTT